MPIQTAPGAGHGTMQRGYFNFPSLEFDEATDQITFHPNWIDNGDGTVIAKSQPWGPSGIIRMAEFKLNADADNNNQIWDCRILDEHGIMVDATQIYLSSDDERYKPIPIMHYFGAKDYSDRVKRAAGMRDDEPFATRFYSLHENSHSTMLMWAMKIGGDAQRTLDIHCY